MPTDSFRRHRIAFGFLLMSAVVLATGFTLLPRGENGTVYAAQACPFVDGDGGTSGIQVTANATIAAVPTPGDYYDCTASDVTVKAGVNVTLNTNTATGTFAEIHFANLTIESTAIVNSDALGCAAAILASKGPNASNVCITGGSGVAGSNAGSNTGDGGGAHGGAGGAGTTMSGGAGFDSSIAPSLFGTSGGSGDGGVGGAGGGVVRLDVSGTFTHEGSVRVNAADGISTVYGQGTGGGAGGSIYITVSGQMNGTSGAFAANGGNGGDSSGDGGGGGGGRIAIVHNGGSFAFDSTDFVVTGGSATGFGLPGSTGTVYEKNTNTDAVKVFHGFSFDNTALTATSWTVDASATNQYCLLGTTTPSLTATTISLAGTQTCDTLAAGAALSYTATGTMQANSYTYTGKPQTYLNVSGGGSVTLTGTVPLPTLIAANVNWSTIGGLSMDANSSVDASGKGCVTTSGNTSFGPNGSNVCVSSGGSGAGGNNPLSGSGDGGAGHGGAGGASYTSVSGGSVYDSAIAPSLFGATGGSSDGVNAYGGAGGGVIRMNVSGSVVMHGHLRANGADGVGSGTFTQGTGGGAGGSIYLTASGAMSGSTSADFVAHGGDGGVFGVAKGGGGGGGRIAVVHGGGSFPFSSARFSVNGGTALSASVSGGKGTVYTKDTTADAITVYHGFSFDNTTLASTSWTTDASVTDMYCMPGTTATGISATTITLSGQQTCATLGEGQAFLVTSSGTVNLTAFTYDGPARSYFNVSGGAAVTVLGGSTVHANLNWSSISNIIVDASSTLSANAKGCVTTTNAQSFGPNGSNTCVLGGSGAGGNLSVSGEGTGGGGHGGIGGNGNTSAVGGTTYDTSSAPVLFGSTGGSADGTGAFGGAGGGVIRLNVSGTAAINGTISASGGNGVGSADFGQGTGGGSGGSIYVTIAGGYSCPSANPVWRAVGGTGGVFGAGKGGGGGGGIIFITSASDSCTAQLTTLLASTIAAGGGATSAATAGDTGLYNYAVYIPTGTTPTLNGNVRLDRLKVGVSTAVDISFTLQGTRSGLLTVTFPAGFTSITAPTGGSACLSGFGTSGQTITATKTACSGTITLTGTTVTNPATPGPYLISWINDDPGSAMVYITLEDQVNVEATIDPFISVNVGTQASATACDGTFAGNGGALAFGSLTPSVVASSDASSVPHICLRISTNAPSGAIVTVKSANAALKSLSSLDQIASGTATLIAGTSGYGLCIGSAGNDSGLDVTAPTGSAFTIVSPFNGSCSSSLHQVGALLTGRQNILSTAAPSQNAFARIYIKASISPNTPAHNDYKDTLTFIVTGTY